MTLSEYVEQRNGVPMGHAASLKNMLKRSFGAGTLTGFWQYWNPIWGYYLNVLVFTPLKKRVGPVAAFLFSFIVSGAIHDAAVMVITRRFQLLFTLVFFFLGSEVLIARKLKIDYRNRSRLLRIVINTSYLAITILLVRWGYERFIVGV